MSDRTFSYNFRRRIALGAIAAVTVVAICFRTVGAEGANSKIQIFLPTSPIAWGFYLADKKGYFKSEGLDVTLRVFSSGAEGAQAFKALGAEMLEAGEMPAMLFVNRNAGSTALIAQVAQSSKGIQLIGPTNIKGPADLKGKKIATNLGSTTEYYLTKYLSDNKLAGQVTVINLDPGSQVPALIRGDVDAIVSFLEVGVRVLSSDRYHLIDAWGSSLMLAATTKFADSQPEAVEGILRALKRAAADVRADPKAALAAVSGSYGLIDAAYQNYLSYGGIDLTPQYPAETNAFLRDMSEFLVRQKKLDQPFDFCGHLNLRFLAKVDPQAVGGAPKCK
jgi:ABC-type nitrate/sulfonate/bicarbonate transport system substrate-binding protein